MINNKKRVQKVNIKVDNKKVIDEIREIINN